MNAPVVEGVMAAAEAAAGADPWLAALSRVPGWAQLLVQGGAAILSTALCIVLLGFCFLLVKKLLAMFEAKETRDREEAKEDRTVAEKVATANAELAAAVRGWMTELARMTDRIEALERTVGRAGAGAPAAHPLPPSTPGGPS